ncbi:MAG: NUDIX hydrolase [Pseudomonadota bacterium]
MTRGDLSPDALTARLTGEERDRSHPPIKVRDAASLIILDREGPSGPSVLMGRRSARHTFMPNRFVFPGGRVDPADSRVAVASSYGEATARRLGHFTSARVGVSRQRAFGIAALREAFEETGVLIAKPDPQLAPKTAALSAFAKRGLALHLSHLTLVARAITPPGRPRRYDTRFFLAERTTIHDIDPSVVGEDAELEEIAWVPIDEARHLPLPTITITVLDELTARLHPKEPVDKRPVPFYRWERKGFVRHIMD